MTTTTDEMLFARPASVHFGGFQLERSVTQRVRVHNNGAKAVRLRYTFPAGKKGFKASFASTDRPPFVSPGLSEEILVSFTPPPAGFQYYYDCIQVRCEEVAYGSSADVARSGATLIPLHAYPMVNEVAFPTRMDFGVVPRGTCARKYVDITCSVPVEFEYELRVTKPHPAFTVFPLTGNIPPRGEARIELEFRPLMYATASAELELHVSQLGFIPRVCTLVGSSSSTAVESSSAIEAVWQKTSLTAPNTAQEKPRGGSEAQRKPSNVSALNNGVQSTSRKYAEKPEFDDTDGEVELEKVGGIEIPPDLNSVTSVSFVLNQEPGKLKPKDLKKAIAANRALQQQQREEQAKLSAASVLGGEDESVSTLSFQTLMREENSFLERSGVSKQVKDMFFQQELREIAEAEKALEFQSQKVHLGQRLLSREQIAQIVRLRELNSQALSRQQRERLRTTFVNMTYEPPIISDNQHNQSGGDEFLLPGECKTAVLPAHFVPAYTPDFKPYKNDMWARRQRLLRRLVRAVSTCIIRLRAQKRLNCIRAWLGGAKTRARVREKVALDWEASTQAGGDGSVSIETKLQNPEQERHDSESNTDNCQYYLLSFPVLEESTTQKRRDKIALPTDWELKFNSFTFMELKPRDEALLMGHEPLPLPTLPTYVPLEQGRKLRQGAVGECGVVTSLLQTSETNPQSTERSNNEQLQAVILPSLLETLPPDAFLRPQASVRPLMKMQDSRDTEPCFVLRPRRVFRSPPSSFFAWQSSQIGLVSVVGSHDSASLYLSDVFIGSADRKPVEPIFPLSVESSTTEASQSIFGDIWSVITTATPSLADRAEEVSSLSDSESDNDYENDTSSKQISWKQAQDLFEDEEGGGLEANLDIYEAGELVGCEKGVYSFERYRHLIRQERVYNSHRQERLEQLPKVRAELTGNYATCRPNFKMCWCITAAPCHFSAD
ncbi:unnamed protein product [Phytophthora fragariaefolia]|uniref:Unnamed protein product n=1 Tax=Phytophthora fragariaefolia TaxID=1490495 RepID=A0A9W6Y321_9STRA|nr:unnamed protein product [Phytophthora fragariaefolia]